MIRRISSVIAVAVATIGAAAVLPASADPPGSPVVVHSGLVTRQDVKSQPGSEADTVVEPDVAVSPIDANIAVAVAHDSRYADGGAVSISAAYTTDGGAQWNHHTVPGITTATGGPYDRASDPVVAFGPNGGVYLSVLVFDANNCDTAVAVLTSTDGGRSWNAPHYAQQSSRCKASDDKNWLVVDTSKASPYYGRVYQFWTYFLSDSKGFVGSPQVVRWSDDHGKTWSPTTYIAGRTHGTQASQPMIEADGTVVDTYYDYGPGVEAPDVVPGGSPESPAAQRTAAKAPPIQAYGSIYAQSSFDGGKKWTDPTEVVANAAGYADGVRCCLFGADIDHAKQRMYVAYEGGIGHTDPVYVSWSDDGFTWSSPIAVSQGDVNGVQRVNVDVVADRGSVYVDYGTRTNASNHGGVVQQQISASHDSGRSFGPPSSIGPVSHLRYSAEAGGHFPGDYIGEAINGSRLYAVWALSSPPPAYSNSKYHQVIYGATMRV